MSGANLRHGIALLVAALAIGAAGSTLRSPAEALWPVAPRAIVDAHAAHAPESPSCAACHPAAPRSAWASEQLGPRMSDCAACHPEAREASALSAVTDACRRCHVALGPRGAPEPDAAPQARFRFSHRAHASQPCGDCHPAAAAGKRPDNGHDLVGMRTCYGCHERRGGALTRCRTCHLAHPDGRMVTMVDGLLLTPPDWLAGRTHGAEWRSSHAALAGAKSELCASCHQEADCRRCHAGRIRPRDVHPGDWLTAHAVSTRMDNPRCATCHRTQSFCIGCHRRAGVAPDSPSRVRPEGARFHRGEAPERICRRARFDIAACASCHSESSCITCHATINPHPAGFARRCKPLAQRNQRACEKCHGDGVWRRCE